MASRHVLAWTLTTALSLPSLGLASPDASLWHTLAANRELQIQLLEDYLVRGEFPHNIGHPSEPTPYFIDHRGVACAIGHLMMRSGWEREAREVARVNNHVRIASLTEGPVLDWILTSGLTQEEAARIQPSYNFLHRNPGLSGQGERERIQQHLRTMLAELREGRSRSLFDALDRLLEHRAQEPDFRVARMQLRVPAAVPLRAISSRPLRLGSFAPR